MRISDWSSDVWSSDLPLDRRIMIAVARRMGISFADLAGRIGVGRKLDHPEGRGGSGKSVAFWAGADQGIDEGQRIGRHLCGERPGGSRQQQRAEERRPPHRTATMEGLKHGFCPIMIHYVPIIGLRRFAPCPVLPADRKSTRLNSSH